MTKISNKKIAENIKRLIFQKADDFGYTSRSKPENGRFFDELVEDVEVGGVLRQYMANELVRTYIKDGVINSYTKQKKREILDRDNFEAIIKNVYDKTGNLIQKETDISVYRLENNKILLLSKGTTLKWETALRKALDVVAKYPNLTINKIPPEICLHLAVMNKGTTESDKTHIKKALATINVKVWFAE